MVETTLKLKNKKTGKNGFKPKLKFPDYGSTKDRQTSGNRRENQYHH